MCFYGKGKKNLNFNTYIFEKRLIVLNSFRMRGKHILFVVGKSHVVAPNQYDCKIIHMTNFIGRHCSKSHVVAPNQYDCKIIHMTNFIGRHCSFTFLESLLPKPWGHELLVISIGLEKDELQLKVVFTIIRLIIADLSYWHWLCKKNL